MNHSYRIGEVGKLHPARAHAKGTCRELWFRKWFSRNQARIVTVEIRAPCRDSDKFSAEAWQTPRGQGSARPSMPARSRMDCGEWPAAKRGSITSSRSSGMKLTRASDPGTVSTRRG